MGKALRRTEETMPVLVSLTPEALHQHEPQSWTCTHLASCIATSAVSIPPDVFCHTVQELEQPGKDRAFLATVGKPTDRWHVEWVRRWTFPALRCLARMGIKPNHITGVGCGVALVACWLIARGGYWAGIWGALLLYTSWVLDCMDGTLARLTLAESAFGQKLDTVLGHLSNLCIFAALIWAVYGEEPAWKGAVMALFILGGIVVAQRLSAVSKNIHRQRGPSHPSRLHAFLEKINHRDYAVLIFVLAVVKGFHIFLWLSLVGIQVYWVLQLWLLCRRARAVAQT
jgi:phosphatidylglycerophosphate synthase